jgi:hypothetical protein
MSAATTREARPSEALEPPTEPALDDPLDDKRSELRARRRYELRDDAGFNEVPKKYRKFYRVWNGDGDALAPNEVLCPVCNVVIRSKHELFAGDRVYCMACMTRLEIVVGQGGRLEAHPLY